MHFVFGRVFHVKHPFPFLFCDETAPFSAD